MRRKLHISGRYALFLPLSALFLLLPPLSVAAQSEDEAGGLGAAFVPKVKVAKVMFQGDSIPFVELNPVYVYPTLTFRSKRQQQNYNRLVRNIKKVLPIAKEVNNIIIETYEYTNTLKTKKERQKHLKLVEQSVKRDYTPRMKRLSLTQGKLLIKLVYRECNSSSYQLVNAFLGPVRAGFYQAFAWTFGASLTKKYDPEGEDAMTERIVRQVEAGQI